MRVIAEWGQTNRGDIDIACRQATVAAKAGCFAAKWQLLTPGMLAAPDAPAYWAHAHPGEQQRDTFARNGVLAYDQWEPVVQRCGEEGIVFLATPFDLRAVEALFEFKVPAVKIASGDITYRDLLEHIGATDMAVFLSTGASSGAEIARALDWLGDDTRVTLLACDLVYPCTEDRANLARVSSLRADFAAFPDDDGRIDVGYSDHTFGTAAALAAAALGAVALEKHVTLDCDGGTPDDEMGLPFQRLAEYVQAAKRGEMLRGSGVLAASPWETPARIGARRSWHATVDLRSGDRLDGSSVRALRPCPPGALSVAYDPAGLELREAVAAGSSISLSAVGLGLDDEYPSPL